MHGTRTWSGESALAWTIVIAVHALAWGELSRIDMLRSDQSEASARLQLTWIRRDAPRIVAAPTTISPPSPRAPHVDSGSDAGSIRDADNPARDTAHSTLQPARSLSAVFLEQARRHAESIAHAERLPADPFVSRTGGFEPPALDTIRMKPRIPQKMSSPPSASCCSLRRATNRTPARRTNAISAG